MTTIINKNGFEFLECISLNENEMEKYEPLAGSYALVRFEDRYLICFNTWRNQWELPAGGRNEEESAKECAIRELLEETAQVVYDMVFIGLLKVRKPDGAIKYNPIYFADLEYIVPFKVNDETDKIMLWNLTDDIGYIDEVDQAVLKWCNSIALTGNEN
ncbi:NUDIX domain-containing protein [Paenibacillus sp. CF384]|uniref:NUDIX domain-containing protein n=1 Tax=Paenibacillus sp. CF384 TaxID=1884382 RepID=UPI00089D942F|nr:NUDIX hydrolase [Paenibacillus sp. CF384]SDW21989.1 8-oxo-dGTP diphosphatase [Paenibacillus sp. CF384]